MLKEFLKGNMKIVDSVDSWEDAIKIGAQPLLDNGNIKAEYIQAMIDSVHKNGPYMVLVDHIAMPHARPEMGVVKTGMSFLKIKNGVDFHQTDEKVYLFFTLAAADSDGHQDAIADLADLFDDEEKMEKMIKGDVTEDEILGMLE